MKGKKAFIPSFLTGAVIFSLLFSTFVVIWGMLQAGDGVDSAAIVDSALRVFGTELGICGVMTVFRRWAEQQDRRSRSTPGYGGNRTDCCCY